MLKKQRKESKAFLVVNGMSRFSLMKVMMSIIVMTLVIPVTG